MRGPSFSRSGWFLRQFRWFALHFRVVPDGLLHIDLHGEFLWVPPHPDFFLLSIQTKPGQNGFEKPSDSVYRKFRMLSDFRRPKSQDNVIFRHSGSHEVSGNPVLGAIALNPNLVADNIHVNQATMDTPF